MPCAGLTSLKTVLVIQKSIAPLSAPSLDSPDVSSHSYTCQHVVVKVINSLQA